MPQQTLADSTSNWFHSDLGGWLLEQEKTLCKQLIPAGYYPSALQVGMSHTDLLDQTETGSKFVVRTPSLGIGKSPGKASGTLAGVLDGEENSSPGTNIPDATANQEPVPMYPLVAEATALPFGERSHSLIVLPHQLDFCRDPHSVLREVNQILIPEGCVVISGFNRLSLWGLGGMWRGRYHHAPWSGRYCRPGQIQDWLSLLGYDVVGARQLAYGPALQNEKWRSRFGFMEKMGDRWWPAMGSAFVIVGKKREIARKPGSRRLAWQQFIPAIARPAVQSGNSMPNAGDQRRRQHLRLVADKESK